VGWILERLDALWPGGLAWEHDAGEHPHEAHHLKVDSSRARALLGWAPRWGLDDALRSIVDWHAALDAGADMRAVSLAQLDAFRAASERATGAR
jgi:CDP-glucose 4,6-dehydratase